MFFFVFGTGPFRFGRRRPVGPAMTDRCACRSLEPERGRERPTVTEAVNARDLSLGRAGAGVPVLGLGLRGLLARPVTQANQTGDSPARVGYPLVEPAVKRR